MAKQYVVTPSQMKKAEAMCEQKGTSCAVLMRNVGSAIALHISRIVKPCRAAVLVGSGNNGGDGFAVAHNLRKRLLPPHSPRRLRPENRPRHRLLQRVQTRLRSRFKLPRPTGNGAE